MKKLTFFIIFVFTAISIAAQSRTTMDILKSYKWEADELKNDELINYFDIYTSTTFKTSIVYYDETLYDNYQYYLSDVVEHTFNPSKVGTVQYGKHIIAKQVDTGKVSCYRIITLNDTELCLMYLHKPGEVRLGVGPITFKAKSK